MFSQVSAAHCKVEIDGIDNVPKVMQATVSLGHDDRASNCQIVFDDPENDLAARLIEMSFETGGIVGLPQPPPPVSTLGSNSASLNSALNAGGNIATPESIIQEAQSQGVTARHHLAFILAVAQGESNFNHNAYNPETGTDIPPYGGRGLGQITHDYNYEYYAELLGIPLDSDLDLAFRPDVSTFILVHGINRGWTSKGGLQQWMPTPTSDRQTAYSKIQGGVWRTDYDTYYREWLAKLGAMDAVSSTQEPIPSEGGVDNLNKEESPENIKGRVIRVFLGVGTEPPWIFEYIHTATQTNHIGETTLSGQSIRWELNRQKKNTAHQNITLKELAQKVCEAKGLDLSMDEDGPEFEYIDQTGISDYQLLRRECEHHGYTITENGATLVIEKPEEAVRKRDPFLFIYRENLSTWVIEDKAASQLEDLPESVGQNAPGAKETAINEASHEVDIATGEIKMSQVVEAPEGTTGEPDKPVVGKTMGESTPVSTRHKMKRVQGLPSGFKTTTEPEMLGLEPLTPLITEGFPQDVFNRAWVVDTVTHTYRGSLTTELEVVTPMEVLDLEPPKPPGAPVGDYPTPRDGWTWPGQSNTCGPICEFGHARGRLHAGIDLGGAAAVSHTMIAACSGVVKFTGFINGYGLTIEIERPDGWWCRNAHMETIDVSTGQQVTIGEPIGLMGSSGGYGALNMNAYAQHLHFEVRDPSGRALNPRDILPTEGAPPMFGG